MKKFVQSIDEITKECLGVALGDDIEYYKSIGMTEQDIEQAYNGNWYLKGYAPTKPLPTVEEQNEVIRQTRQQAYIETTDSLYMDYQESLARGEETAEEKKQLWLSAKDKIREENPYLEENHK